MEEHFRIETLDPAKLIKANNLQEIVNPIYFVRDNVPTSDGLLSNEIFGIAKTERSEIFAYVDLTAWFIDPLCYKVWTKMDSKVRAIVHGTNKFIINSKGEFEENEKGSNGIKFLKDNMDKIKIKSTESAKRDVNIEFIMKNKELMFIKQYIIIPAYYRDVNSNGGYVGVGEINKLYDSLIIAVRALRETADYGLSMSSATNGRIQEIILQIYNWFADEPNISKKHGIIKRANMSKSADYASRLVLSAPDLRVENLDDLKVNLDYSALPLASACTNLYPYMIFYIRRFFENEFSGLGTYPYKDKKGELHYVKVKDPLIEFSDERIKKELDNFIHGYSNRLIPIEVPNEEKKKIFMYFKGREITPQQLDSPPEDMILCPIINRKMTWCDLMYMAACEVSKDKVALITRYPIDSVYNQFPTKVVIASTKETEPVFLNNTLYKHYPKIRAEDIGSNTSSTFIDTLNICNLFLGRIGGDYDGDMVTVKIAYTNEANEELMKHMNSKSNYISAGAQNTLGPGNEAIQALFNLTLALPGTKLTNPVF